MPPKKRRQPNNNNNNKENPLSIQEIIKTNSIEFETNYADEVKHSRNEIEKKFQLIHQEFDKYLQTHQLQLKLARLLDQEIIRLSQQQTILPCQELLNKTTDLMNASMSDASRTKTYLIGELQMNMKNESC